MAAPNFDAIRPTVPRLEKPTLPLSAALAPFADPTSATPLTLGEWLLRTADEELARPTNPAADEPLPSFPYWEWTGQTDVQASLKGTILLPIYEAWTLVWDALNPPTAYGDPLAVRLQAAGPFTGYGVLRLAAGGGFTVGFALGKLPTSSSQPVYFRANY